MSEWKILITDGLADEGLDILAEDAQVDEHQGIPAEELIVSISGYDALIVRGGTRVTSEVLAAGKKLKVVGRAGVGVDNIDLAAANLHNVTVVNSPRATTQAVAEHTMALIFSLARSIPLADAGMKSGLWLKKQYMGVEIKDKVLGIIGMGHIGSLVAGMAKSMGMKVLGYDPLVSAADIQARHADPAALQEIYSQSDFISIHVPLNPDTKNLIDGQAFSEMKRGMNLICTARGGVINETALLGALEAGQVAGAALDVYAQEPPGLSALVSHPRVVTTPHIAAQTREAQARAAVDIANEVLAVLRGDPLRWKIV